MNDYRGIPASALHNTYRHMYVSVDTSASNWRSYLLDRINQLEQSGIIHVMDCNTYNEIDRIMA